MTNDSHHRTVFTSVVLVAALVSGACSGSSETAEPSATEPVATEPVATEPAAWYEWAPTSAIAPPFRAKAPLLSDEFREVEPGAYRTDALGTEISFELDDGEWWVQPNQKPILVLSSAKSTGPGDEDIVFHRPSHLADPTHPNAAMEHQRRVPADDIRSWLATIMPGVAMGEPAKTQLGGLEATVFHLQLAESIPCGIKFCVGFITNHEVQRSHLEKGTWYRVYWVDQGEEDPVAVIIGAAEGNTEWLMRAEEMLETLTFGQIEPNPVAAGPPVPQGFTGGVAAGPVEVPIGRGLRFEVLEAGLIYQRPGFAGVSSNGPYESDLVLVSAGFDGTPITTAADVVASLEANPRVMVTGSPNEEVAGLEALVIEFQTDGSSAAIPDLLTDGGYWISPLTGRAWIMDTGDGPLMITAEGFETGAANLQRGLAVAQRIMDTLEFARRSGFPATITI